MAGKTSEGAGEKVKFLAEFSRLAVNSRLLRAPQTSKEPAPFIVLCTWMGAQPKHIAKYTDVYRERYPEAGILLITCEPADMLTRSFVKQRKTLAPTKDVLLPIMELDNKNVLLHVFSHGGCNSAIQLAKSYNDSHGKPFEFNAFILDSCPGRPSLGRSVRAMSVSLPPNFLIRTVLTAIFWVFLGFIYFLVFIGVRKGTDLLRQDLLTPELFPKDTKRLYMYSEADLIVDYEGIRDHAEEAKAAGYKSVTVEVFKKSPHCGLIREDEERYWAAVEKIWPKRK